MTTYVNYSKIIENVEVFFKMRHAEAKVELGYQMYGMMRQRTLRQ